ncbi:MAG: phosphatase PAP2 family protein [Nocardioidaceae bacterium]
MERRADTSRAARDRIRASGQFLRHWPYTFGIGFSIVVVVVTFLTARDLDLPIRDPEGFLGPSYIRLPLLGMLFIAGGIVLQALFRTRSVKIWTETRRIVRDEWTWMRLVNVGAGLVTFYACYVSYRNLKSFLPIIREGVLEDHWMLKLDYTLFFHHYPALVLHDLFGTGISAQFLSSLYLSYLVLVPVSLAIVLVWSRDISLGCWYATALSLNWILGVVSYYSLPTLGPAFADQALFADLPVDTGVAALQEALARNGAEVRADPWSADSIYGIAGFASLHVSVVVSACLFFHRIGMRRSAMSVLWAYLALVVVATLYFGWHYIADDVAGALIGWICIVIGAKASGNFRTTRASSKANRLTEHEGLPERA